MKNVYISRSPLDTQNFAKEFAKNLKPGDAVALYGDLGAGKTTFIQGLAAGLDYKGKVTSPTFIIIRTYEISDRSLRALRPLRGLQRPLTSDQQIKIKKLHHIDLYRVEGAQNLKTVGVEEFLRDSEAVAVIEWSEKIEKLLPKEAIKINIEVTGENQRKIRVGE